MASTKVSNIWNQFVDAVDEQATPTTLGVVLLYVVFAAGSVAMCFGSYALFRLFSRY